MVSNTRAILAIVVTATVTSIISAMSYDRRIERACKQMTDSVPELTAEIMRTLTPVTESEYHRGFDDGVRATEQGTIRQMRQSFNN